MKLSLSKRISLFFRALEDFNRFFDEKNKNLRTLVFYSEKDIYYLYYEGFINQILANSDLDICYLTSDHQDPIFKTDNNRIKPFYIGGFESSLFSRLDSKVVVMTMPDLNQFYIKKSINDVNYIYVFHAIVSTHLQYRFGAFDHYDTIFCVGPHHTSEIQKAEAMYQLAPKQLVNCGYHRLEKIFNDHQDYLRKNLQIKNSRKSILVAPTWGEHCILETCIKDLINTLGNTQFDVFIRPHPEFVKRRSKLVDQIAKIIKNIDNIKLELNLTSDVNIHNADILITDRSGIAFEYAFGTERPVLFIDTPPKVQNPRYQELGIEPLEVTLRNQIGLSVSMTEISKITGILNSFIADYDMYHAKIVAAREQYIYNWMNSAQVGADHIIKKCKAGV